MKPFGIVVAVDDVLGIGKAGGLPWHLPEDLRHFKELTSATDSPSHKNAVIMGRRTWESIPEKFRPLQGRINLVLTRNKSLVLPAGVLRAESLSAALLLLNDGEWKKTVETIYVIGGAEAFKEALRNPQCQKIYMTRVVGRFDCDVFFPPFQNSFAETLKSPRFTENSIQYYFAVYNRI